MGDELSSLKLNFYLFSSTDNEKFQYQKHLTVEVKKVGVQKESDLRIRSDNRK